MYGYASGIGAPNQDCASAPTFLLENINKLNSNVFLESHGMVESSSQTVGVDSLPEISRLCTALAEHCAKSVRKNELFLSVGGDHSMGIGTWSGVAHVMRDKGDVGLLWIDAHLDAHTAETTESGNIHGMPVAHLLGYGHQSLTNILDGKPKVKPSNVFIIGARDYEKAEVDFLDALGVRIYFIDEVQEKGLLNIITEVVQYLNNNTVGIGLSVDLDAIDPKWAPGTGLPINNGIEIHDLLDALKFISQQPSLLGVEIAEYNPLLDVDDITLKTVDACLSALFGNYSRPRHPER